MDDGAKVRAAAERLREHRRVVRAMEHPRDSPYTFIEVSTGAAGFVPEAETKDMATVVTAYLDEHPPLCLDAECGRCDGCRAVIETAGEVERERAELAYTVAREQRLTLLTLAGVIVLLAAVWAAGEVLLWSLR